MWWRPSPLPPRLPAPSLLPWVPTGLLVLPLGVPELLLLPTPPWLLPPRPRPCLPPLLRSRPRRAPLRPLLSLEANACSGCLEDRCAPFFRGRLEWRVLTMRMISSRSLFLIACSVSLTREYSSGSARTKRACSTASGIRPIPYSCIWLFVSSRS